MASSLKLFDLAKIRTHELLKQTVDYLVTTYNAARQTFTVASPLGQTMFVQQNLANLIFYYIEDSITEMSLQSATRRSSVYGLAALAGYAPSRAMASTGEVLLSVRTNTVEDLPSNIVIIPNYTQITCVNNGLNYVMIMPSDEMKLSLTDQNVIPPIMIKQGRVETQSFTGTGERSQSVTVRYNQNSLIENYFVNVYVNDVKLPRYESLLQMPRGVMGYMVNTGISTGVDVFFGNDNYGAIVPLGATIRIEYLVTEGYAGKIVGAAADQILFTFADSGFNLLGAEVDLNEIMGIKTSIIPEYGANPEPIYLTKMMLSKTNSVLLSLSSYELLLRRLQSFSIIRVYADPADERMVCLFLVPDVSKLMAKNETYFSVPESRFSLTQESQNNLLKFISMTGTQLIATDVRIVEPVLSRYALNISIITTTGHDAPSPDVIKSDIYNVLSNYFLNVSRRGRIPRSDLIRIIEGVDGVDSVNIVIVCANNERAKKIYPSGADIGLDEFNDIIIGDNELPIIRGGWTDRYGNYYDKGMSTTGLGAVNIQLRTTTQDSAINNKNMKMMLDAMTQVRAAEITNSK